MQSNSLFRKLDILIQRICSKCHTVYKALAVTENCAYFMPNVFLVRKPTFHSAITSSFFGIRFYFLKDYKIHSLFVLKYSSARRIFRSLYSCMVSYPWEKNKMNFMCRGKIIFRVSCHKT